MSLVSKITLGASCAISLYIVGYVHYQQSSDRSKLHEGVLKDIQRQQRRKIENIYNLQQQNQITKQLQQDLDKNNVVQTPSPNVS